MGRGASIVGEVLQSGRTRSAGKGEGISIWSFQRRGCFESVMFCCRWEDV